MMREDQIVQRLLSSEKQVLIIELCSYIRNGLKNWSKATFDDPETFHPANIEKLRRILVMFEDLQEADVISTRIYRNKELKR